MFSQNVTTLKEFLQKDLDSFFSIFALIGPPGFKIICVPEFKHLNTSTYTTKKRKDEVDFFEKKRLSFYYRLNIT